MTSLPDLPSAAVPTPRDTLFGEAIRDGIAQALSAAYGQPVGADAVMPVADDAFKEELPDATAKFYVPRPNGKQGFLILSGPGNPALLSRAVDNIHHAIERTGGSVALPILPPCQVGEVAGRSFAVWSEKLVVEDAGRVGMYVMRRRFGHAVCEWINAFAAESAVPADPAVVRRDLGAIEADEGVSQALRDAAIRARQRLDEGAWAPTSCLQHNDFWLGNLVLPKNPWEARFYVVDWAGMVRDGYPFFDLLRMLLSLGVTRRERDRLVDALASRLGCDGEEDVSSHIVAALGRVRRDLEHFPVERFRPMADTVYAYGIGDR